MRDPHLTGPAASIANSLACTVAALAACLVILTGCNAGPSGKAEYVYVAVPEASLRDHVSTVYNKTGLVHNGEHLQVLERMPNKRFVRVRTPRGEEGWVQERYLADQQTFDQFQRLAERTKDRQVQATATVEEQIKVHIQPGRKTGYLYLLNEKEKVGLLERQPVNKNAASTPVKDADVDSDSSDDDAANNAQPAIWEDWWLVRDSQQRVGWVLGRTLYLDVPDEIGQYAEGQRIVAAYPLDEVEDQGKKVSQYLVLFTEPKDGQPYDFNQIRVYTWNTRKHRYETAYRERNLAGTLPVSLGQQEFEHEGSLRTFTLRLTGDNGQPREQMYKFKPPVVHKVHVPGEEPASKPHRKPAHRAAG
jgi:SH3-like domain-containing protein